MRTICPRCEERVDPSATTCVHCGEPLTSDTLKEAPPPPPRMALAAMNPLARLFWIIAIGCTLWAAAEAFIGFRAAQSAPQQAAVAGYACALVIIPYVLARALDELTSR
jgi:hypothetical protein